MIVSQSTFLWFNTLMVAGIGVVWVLWDGRNLIRLWKTRGENHDEFFGAIIGLIIAAIGFTGLIRHHLAL